LPFPLVQAGKRDEQFGNYVAMIMLRWTLWLVIGLCAGCQPGGGDIERRIVAAEAAASQAQSLAFSALYEATTVQRSTAATVRLDEKTFDVAATRMGPVTVSAQSVAPYMDGFKITLRFGNLTSATLTGASVQLGWGTNGKKRVQIAQDFRAGAFTDVEVIVSPASAKDISEIVVTPEFTGVVLRRPGKSAD